MMKIVFIGLFATAAFAPAGMAAEVYEVDPAHTAVTFEISHLGFSTTHGAFPGVSGSVTIDEEDPKNNSVEITIDAGSIDTNNQMRDDHLRNEDFFDVAKYPTITFKSTEWKKKKDGWDVTGELTLHGVTKTVSVEVENVGQGEGMKGEYRRGFQTEFKIKRSDYGMTNMVGPVGDDVKLEISMETIRKEG